MRLVRIVLLAGVAALGACGGGSKAILPVDSPLKPWEAPEMEEAEPQPETPAPEAARPNK